MTERWVTINGIEHLVLEDHISFQTIPANDYPAQAYFWKHSKDIRRAELAWRRKRENESEQPGRES